MVETAKEWKVPPLQVVLGRPVTWSMDDTKLSMAFQILEKETCKDCGQPAWIGHNTDRRIMFRTPSAHCYGCQELEKRREDKTRKIDKGEKPYVEAHMWDDSALPSRQEAFERRAKREQ